MGNGLVLVDDFAIADLPATATDWLRPWVAQAIAARLLGSTPHPVVSSLLGEGSKPVLQDDHEVHTARAMERALHDHFMPLAASSAPYLYRYLAASVRERPEGAALVRDALAAERRSIDSGWLWPLGRRWVAKASA